MNENISKSYNSSLSLVKALDMQNKKIFGYYIEYEKKHLVKPPNESSDVVKVNPYTICRNSGITDKNGFFVFEYDLLKLTHGLKSPCYGFLVWDEFYKSWKIRRRTDRTAYNNVDEWTIEVVGNIVLDDEDAEIIFRQEATEDSEETFIDNSYCPSKFRR